jgi:hypothetical protein
MSDKSRKSNSGPVTNSNIKCPFNAIRERQSWESKSKQIKSKRNSQSAKEKANKNAQMQPAVMKMKPKSVIDDR